jgi:hypothetical protein|tara:strand:+ start:25088 stop:25273 length:186 start_codon:yes stop_codon:yes gene_type:complete
MIITAMDCFYIFMIAFIMTFLVVIEIQLHTMKSTMEEYINIRLNPKKMKEKSNIPEKPLTK